MARCKTNATALKKEMEIQKKEEMEKKRREDSTIKIALFGTGESGKSTVLKQLQRIHGPGFSSGMLKSYKHQLINNLVDGCGNLVRCMKNIGLEFNNLESAGRAELVSSRTGPTPELTQEIADAIVGLWDDKSVKLAFEQRSKFQAQDTLGYFMEQLRDFPKWGGRDWTPNESDIVHALVRSTGIMANELMIRNARVRFLDVSGQRAERKKWIHTFYDLTAVIFVVAIQEYDQALFEDNTKNRLIEARDLFQQTVMNQCFKNTPIMLFLNKSDLFKEKLCEQHVLLNVSGLFTDAPTGFDFEDGVKWIEAFMLDGLPGKLLQNMHVHVTCALDTDIIAQVVDASVNTILRTLLVSSGFCATDDSGIDDAEGSGHLAQAANELAAAKTDMLRPVSPPTFSVEHVKPKPKLGSGAFAPNPETSLAYFSAFAPKTIQPGATFLLNVWAFCKAQRDRVILMEAKNGKSEAGIKGPLSIFIGDKIYIELDLPSEAFALEVANSSDSMEWFGEATNTTFAVTCKADALCGKFACKATIYVDSENDPGKKEKRGVLIFQLNVKKKWGISSLLGFGRLQKKALPRSGNGSFKAGATVGSLPSNVGVKDGDLSATLTILPRNCSPHIFISYRRMHKDLGQLIRVCLERYGYDCFLDINPTTGLGAGDFQAQLEKAMGTAKVVIPLLTPAPSGPPGTKRFLMTSMECLKDAIANNETDFCQFELEWALSDPDKIVLPIYRDIKTGDLGKELSGLPPSLSKLGDIGAFAFHDDMVDACILRTHHQIQTALAELEKKNVDYEISK